MGEDRALQPRKPICLGTGELKDRWGIFLHMAAPASERGPNASPW